MSHARLAILPQLTADGPALRHSGPNLRGSGHFVLSHGEHAAELRLARWGLHAFVMVTNVSGPGFSVASLATKRGAGRANTHPVEEHLLNPTQLHDLLRRHLPGHPVESTHTLVPGVGRTTRIGFTSTGRCASMDCTDDHHPHATIAHSEVTVQVVNHNVLSIVAGELTTNMEITLTHNGKAIKFWYMSYGVHGLLHLLGEPSDPHVAEVIAERDPDAHLWTALQMHVWDPGPLFGMLQNAGMSIKSVETAYSHPCDPDAPPRETAHCVRLGVYPNGRTQHKNIIAGKWDI